MPDADLLQKIAEVLEVSVSQLLGQEREQEKDRNEIAEQLSRINEQLAVKNRRSRRIWTVVGILLGCWVMLYVIGAVVGFALFGTNSAVTTITDVETVEIIEDENGNVQTITKIED